MSMGDFPFNWGDIFYLLGMEYVEGTKSSEYVTCPFCGEQKKLNVNNIKKIYRCVKCGNSGGILSFYAEQKGMSKKDAYHEINELLGLDTNRTLMNKRYEYERKAKKERQTYAMPIKQRDKAYRYLLSLLPLQDDHIENLLNRGLSLPFILAKGYRSYPTAQDELERIARMMINSGYEIKGLPGFYKNENGCYQLRSMKRGILIPVLNKNGYIQGLQLRKDDNLLVWYPKKDQGKIVYGNDGKPIMKRESKFNWLSTPDMCEGGKAEANIHFACNFSWDEEKKEISPILKSKEVYLTEGPMKADIFFFLMGRPTIAVPGVNALLHLDSVLDQLKELGVTTIHNCLDMDYLTNEHVFEAVNNIRDIVKKKGFKYHRRIWDKSYKGIDDYALYLTKDSRSKNLCK